MNKVAKKLLKTIAITAVLMYASLTMFKQEAAFNKYDDEIEKYVKLIEQEELKKEELMNTKSKISSKEYVEEIAREKLGLVMPNEIVFVDANL
ncbi:MAG: septum formation initiator family protein [Clostridia bacterium]|nr:septum formation initiator family protein [Clostridia bacterium]